MTKKVEVKDMLIRYGVSDLILTNEESGKLGKFLNLCNSDGEVVAEVEVYLVGFEDEEGRECDEDGEYLDDEY